MYTPSAFAVDDAPAVLADLLVAHAATLVTTDDDGPTVTVVPLLVVTGADGRIRLQGHVARKNPQARVRDGAPAVVTVVGAQGYVSPSWYPSKVEHGKVVPTWDYVAATAVGTLRLHDDPAWLLDLVVRLTDRHEAGRDERWAVADAPDAFVAAQLRGIVGIEVLVTAVDAVAKLSQNRPPADQDGVIAGLRAGGPAEQVLGAAVEGAVSGPDGDRQ